MVLNHLPLAVDAAFEIVLVRRKAGLKRLLAPLEVHDHALQESVVLLARNVVRDLLSQGTDDGLLYVLQLGGTLVALLS